MKNLNLIFILFFAVSCVAPDNDSSQGDPLVIAFGSCSKQDQLQPLWRVIRENDPDLWIWLGDNIYGDTDDMEVLRKKYQQQLENPGYQKLVEEVEITGIWDDHDYGKNDAGKEYPYKAESQQLFLDFLDVPDSSIRRSRAGIYSSQMLENGAGSQVKLVLLDTRYHRDSLRRGEGQYVPRDDGTMLGEQQWEWLENELKDPVDVLIVASSIQVIPTQHGYEKWANFPHERERLLRLLDQAPARAVLILSGDRHIAEVLAVELDKHAIREITSSSLTHSSEGISTEPNRYRTSDLIRTDNFGVLRISGEDEIEIVASLQSQDDTLWSAHYTYQ